MAKLSIKPGSTSQSLYVWVADSASTAGAGKTGIAYNASGISAYYCRVAGSATAITLATQTATGAYSSGGWAEVSSSNMPGLYRFDVPDAVLAAGVRSAVVQIQGASGMAPVVLEIDLTNDANAVSMSGTSLTGRDIGASVLLSPGTGAGQISLSSGAVTAGTVSDKTGYSLAGNVTVGGYAAGQDPATLVLDTTASGHNTAGTIGAKINAAGSSSDPLANAASTYATTGTIGYYLAHSLGNTGATVATNNDKTGYSLTQALPSNFSALAITAGGAVTVGTNSDKTGYSLVGTEHTQIAADVLNATAASYNTVGTIGAKINQAGSATDPLTNAASTYSTSGTIGYYLRQSLGNSGATVAACNDKTGYSLLLTQAVPMSNTGNTVGDCLNAARAAGFGAMAFSGNTLYVYGSDGSTVVRTFAVDNASAPTQRT